MGRSIAEKVGIQSGGATGGGRPPPGMGHNRPPKYSRRILYDRATAEIRQNDPLNPRGAPTIGLSWVPMARQLNDQQLEAQMSTQYAFVRQMIFENAEVGASLRHPQSLSLSYAQTMRLGREWVGSGAREMSSGAGLVNTENGRTFRYPTQKAYTQGDILVSNFGTRALPANLHIHVYTAVPGGILEEGGQSVSRCEKYTVYTRAQ